MGKKHHVGRTAWVFALVVVVSLCDSFVFVFVLFWVLGPSEQRREEAPPCISLSIAQNRAPLGIQTRTGEGEKG